MTTPITVERSRVIPVATPDAFAGALAIPLPTLLNRRYGPFPPIKAVQGQTDWARAGDSRTIVPAGGGSMRETLTAVDAPGSFGYTITEIRGPMAMLVDHVDGTWTFTPGGAQTTVTWRWALYPRSALTAPVVALLGRLWGGYARGALESLSGHLAR